MDKVKGFFSNEFVRVLLFSICVAYFVFILMEGDAYKGIWVGVFVLLFYYWHNDLLEKFIINKFEKISDKFLSILVFSIFLITAVTLFSNLIFYVFIDVDYCKDGMFFSEERCEIQEATSNIKDKYDGGDYGDFYDDRAL